MLSTLTRFLSMEKTRAATSNFILDPLAHLHSSGGDADTAVGVYVDQGAPLIQHRIGKRNPKADRHEGQPFFLEHVGGIERLDPLQRFLVIVAGFCLLPADRSAAAAGGHAVGEGVSILEQVFFLNIGGTHPQSSRCLKEGGLYHEHPLGTAEAAEGCIRQQVGTTAVGGCFDIGNEVTARAVKQSSFEDRRRQVRRRAGVLIKIHLISQDPAVVIQPDAEVRSVGVALAGEDHVLPPLKHQLYGRFADHRAQSGQSCPSRGLILLPSEGTAQTCHLDFDLMHGQTQ